MRHQTCTLAIALTVLLLTFRATATICSNFTVLPQSYIDRGGNHTNLTSLTVAAPYSYRVSKGIICNETTAALAPSGTCPSTTCLPLVVNGTTISQEGVTNISLPDGDKAAAFDLVGRTAQIPFPLQGTTTFGTDGAETFNSCISPTWAGYLSFSPLLNCVNGIFTGCGGESAIADGTTVRMCAPISRAGKLTGAIFFEQTSDDTANALSLPPDPETPEEDPFVGSSYHSPVPVPTSVAATMVPGQPGLPVDVATVPTTSPVEH